MRDKSRYHTKQHDELVAYMMSIQGRHVTVNDIHAYFQAKGNPIGVTTIYRQLERMMAEGLVSKYTVDGGSSACFEYIGEKKDCHQPSCFHCKCEKCGRLIHLHCDELIEMQYHMLKHHGFYWDPMRTVFYGICDECKRSNP